MIARLVEWANQRDSVRAMLLTSTRAIPDAKVDLLSDYDVILVVDDIAPFALNRSWIGDFGEVLVAYWDPIAFNPEYGFETLSNVVQYEAVLKIDFSLWSEPMLKYIVTLATLPVELDAGYRVLVDKDDIAAQLSAPTFRGYRIEPPDEETYLTLINDYFVGVPYVAKSLLRDELLPAKWVLDYDMRDVYMRPMLEWRAQIDHNWSISLGNLGKGLRRNLPPDIWLALEETYTGASLVENWESLFRQVALFGRIAREVGANLGYVYPEALELRVVANARVLNLLSPEDIKS